METAVDVGAEAPANEAVIADIPVIDTPAASLDDGLRDIWDKHHPARDDGGKFTPKNPVETTDAKPVTDPAAPDVDQTAQTAPEQATPAIEAPLSWSAEQKAKWASVPPDLQAYVAQRDKESHEAITRAGQQIKAFEPIRNVVEQYGHVFQKNGLQPHDGIARMMAVNEMLESNPRAAITEIAKAYGVDLSGQQAEQTANPTDPKVSELEARLAKAESFLTAQQRQQYNTEQTALAREIADFAKDKPHFEAVRSIMAGLMQSGAAEDLKDAYEKATYADPTIRQSILADQQKANEDKRKQDEAERLKAAKKAGGVNVKGSPASAATARTLDDDLREIARKHYGT